jgi:hypothetical protein
LGHDQGICHNAANYSSEDFMPIKKTIISASLLLTLSPMALANTRLLVVDNYSQAADASIWRKVGNDEVPRALQRQVQVSSPGLAYSQLFPKSFYQEEDFLVCFRDCASPDARSSKDLLEQQNVFYWLGQFFKMTRERFNLMPAEQVRVLTTRNVSDPGSTKKMRNNAFFNPADGSLSFLPASANPLAAILGGRINRSGFDPSVVAHEAGHALFHALFPNSVNQEIGGFNEGFADYLANILLNDAKVGVVMLRGRALRDSSSLVDSAKKLKVYEPGLEVHDMGERFAAALWLGREKVSNHAEYDQLIISAIRDISRNAFATGHGFKQAFLARTDYYYPPKTAAEFRAIWEHFIPGTDKVIKDTSFLRASRKVESAWGLRVETKFSESTARDLGISNESQRFLFIKSVETKDGYIAYLTATRDDHNITPYWILIDPERKNALGAWRFDASVVDTEEELKKVSTLTAQLFSVDQTMVDFIQKAKMFGELVEGKGELSAAYRITRRTVTQGEMEFNGVMVNTQTLSLTLGRKLLARIVGVPNLKSVDVITATGAVIDPRWPSVNSDNIIGIRLGLGDDTSTLMLLEHIQL